MVSDTIKFSLLRWTIITAALLFGSPFVQTYVIKYLPFLTGTVGTYVANFIAMFVILIPVDLITRKVWAI